MNFVSMGSRGCKPVLDKLLGEVRTTGARKFTRRATCKFKCRWLRYDSGQRWWDAEEVAEKNDGSQGGDVEDP